MRNNFIKIGMAVLVLSSTLLSGVAFGSTHDSIEPKSEDSLQYNIEKRKMFGLRTDTEYVSGLIVAANS